MTIILHHHVGFWCYTRYTNKRTKKNQVYEKGNTYICGSADYNNS